mmetsp:Transcript_14319/g.20445  ORF Transcript_14319/g.20445 Transcript_14319/m.20445 type:complete len:427 (+) Transcript_14319:58-1338(+)
MLVYGTTACSLHRINSTLSFGASCRRFLRYFNFYSSIILFTWAWNTHITNVCDAAILLPPPAQNLLVDVMVGAASGGTAAFVVYPLDFIKSQLQTEKGRSTYKNGLECFTSHVFRSPKGALGFLDLYRGCFVSIVGIAPEKAIKLTVNDVARAFLLGSSGIASVATTSSSLIDLSSSQGISWLPPMTAEILAGGFAGACQVVITNPIEVVKVRMQTQQSVYDDENNDNDSASTNGSKATSFQKVLTDIISEDSNGNIVNSMPQYFLCAMENLYRGAEACILRDVVFSAILFPIYSHVKIDFIPAIFPNLSTFWCGILAGSISAAPASFLATPADVVKTRVQQCRDVKIINMADECYLEEDFSNKRTTNKSLSILETTQLMMINEGPAVFFSGWLERVVRSVPQFGITLGLFDVLKPLAESRILHSL